MFEGSAKTIGSAVGGPTGAIGDAGAVGEAVGAVGGGAGVVGVAT